MKPLFSFYLLAAFTIFQAKAQLNVGIGTSNPKNKLEVVAAVGSQLNSAIYSTNTGNTGSAIFGVSDAAGTTGVQGSSNFGIGVYGYSGSNTAITAGAIVGTAIYASSVNGMALSVSGKLQFSGGNTNPSAGAVLTSDAAGNAVWKAKRVGFFASGALNTAIPISTFRKVEFITEGFDHQNNFVPTPGSASATSSVFTAPEAGIYHFASSVIFERASTSLESGQIRLIKNNSSTVLANSEAPASSLGSTYHYISLEIDGDFFLNANEKVWVEVAQRNLLGTAAGLSGAPIRGRFSGHLKMAD